MLKYPSSTVTVHRHFDFRVYCVTHSLPRITAKNLLMLCADFCLTLLLRRPTMLLSKIFVRLSVESKVDPVVNSFKTHTKSTISKFLLLHFYLRPAKRPERLQIIFDKNHYNINYNFPFLHYNSYKKWVV